MRRTTITALEAAAKRIINDLEAEADKQQNKLPHIAHELRSDAYDVSMIVRRLIHRRSR